MKKGFCLLIAIMLNVYAVYAQEVCLNCGNTKYDTICHERVLRSILLFKGVNMPNPPKDTIKCLMHALVTKWPNNTNYKINGTILSSLFMDTVKAIESYLTALTFAPNDTSALNILGKLYFDRGDDLLALHFFKKSLELDTTQELINFNLGQYYAQFADISFKKLDLLESIIKIRQDSIFFLRMTIKPSRMLKKQIRALGVRINIDTKQFQDDLKIAKTKCDTVILYYKRCQKQNPNNFSYAKAIAFLYSTKYDYDTEALEEKYKSAIKYAHLAVMPVDTAGAMNHLIYNLLGEIYWLKLNKLDSAYFYFKRCVSIKKDTVSYFINLANVCQEMGKVSETIENLENLIAFSPTYNPGYYKVLGKILDSIGRIDKKYFYYTKADLIFHSSDQTFATWLHTYDAYKQLIDDWETILRFKFKYLQETPNAKLDALTKTLLYSLAKAYNTIDSYVRAEYFFNELQFFYPKNDSINYYLSQIYFKKSDFDKSINFAKKSKRVNKNDQNVVMIAWSHDLMNNNHRGVRFYKKTIRILNSTSPSSVSEYDEKVIILNQRIAENFYKREKWRKGYKYHSRSESLLLAD